MTLDRHGNTSAASIPLAFDAAVKDGRIKRGQLVLWKRWAAALPGARRWSAGEAARCWPGSVGLPRISRAESSQKPR